MPKFPVYPSTVYDNIIRVLKPHVSIRRFEKIAQIFHYRIKDTVLVFENIRDPLNVAACLRTADAYGIQNIYIINSWGEVPFFSSFSNDKFNNTSNKKSSIGQNNTLNTSFSTVDAGSIRWLTIHHHRSTKEVLEELRNDGYTIFSSDLAEGAMDLYQATQTALVSSSLTNTTKQLNPSLSSSSSSSFASLPYRPRVALVFGNERRGVSRGMAMNSDYRFFIPQMGFVQSLNISVACALSSQLFLYRTQDYFIRSLQAHQFRLFMDTVPITPSPSIDKDANQTLLQEIEHRKNTIQTTNLSSSLPSVGSGTNNNSSSTNSSSLANSLVCEPLPSEEIKELLVRWLLADLPTAPKLLERAGVRPDDY